MGAGASQKGGAGTARQKGGGGFAPQYPSPYQTGQFQSPPMSAALGQGIRALGVYGGKGGGGYAPQMQPYMSPYQTPMSQMQPYNSRLMMQRPFDRSQQPMQVPSPPTAQLPNQAAMDQARLAGLQVGPTPGQQPSPLEGLSIQQRQAMNAQINQAAMQADQQARMESAMASMPTRDPYSGMRQTQPFPGLGQSQIVPATQPARPRAAYMPVDQGDGTDQFGAPIQAEPMGRVGGGVDIDQLRDRMSSKGGARTARQMTPPRREPSPAFSSTKGGARSASQARNTRAAGAGIASLASGKGGSRTMRQ